MNKQGTETICKINRNKYKEEAVMNLIKYVEGKTEFEEMYYIGNDIDLYNKSIEDAYYEYIEENELDF